MTLRDRLRKLIGWDEMQASVDLSDSRLTILMQQVDDQKKRIDLIAYKRAIAPLKYEELDWEAQQVAFLSNPENFKEVN